MISDLFRNSILEFRISFNDNYRALAAAFDLAAFLVALAARSRTFRPLYEPQFIQSRWLR